MDPAEQAHEAELIRRARGGDTGAFAALVERWYATLYRWALAWVDDPDDADDVVQRVLVRVHLKLGSFAGRSALSSWLYQITRNVARDAGRQARGRARALDRLEAMAEPGDTTDPAEVLDRRRAVDAARRAVGDLPERQREVFELVDLQGYAPREAAELLGLDHGTVRVHLFRARRTVRAAVLALYPDLREGVT